MGYELTLGCCSRVVEDFDEDFGPRCFLQEIFEIDEVLRAWIKKTCAEVDGSRRKGNKPI